MMTDPKVLLLDEPSIGLAPKIVKEVFEKIKHINEARKISIVIVEHNLKSVNEIAHRTYVLDKGNIVAEGKPKELMDSGILEKVFLGNI
jgi:branched-chain amino acid transport system ATP-binding protein